MSATEGPAEPDQPQEIDPLLKGVGKGCLGIVAVIAALVIGGSIYNAVTGSGGEDSSESGSDADAKEVCRDSVEDQLKAPATAKFSDERADRVGIRWTVTGSVDSENSFGALIRNTYSCDAIFEGGSNWRTRSTLSGN